MKGAAIERRLAELEARIAPLRPMAPKFEWLDCLSNDELDALEELARDVALSGRAFTADEQLRVIEAEAGALRRFITRRS